MVIRRKRRESSAASSGVGSLTTLLFIHGTGVRERRCEQFAEEIQAALRASALDPQIELRSCYWGELGARPRDAMSSVPRPGKAVPVSAYHDDAIELWRLLYDVPLAEFETLTAGGITQAEDELDDFAGRRDWQWVRIRLEELGSDASIAAALADWFDDGTTAFNDFVEAAFSIANAPVVETRLRPERSLGGAAAAMVARAVVAEFLLSRRLRLSGDDAGTDVLGLEPPQLDAERRDALVELVVCYLDLQDLSAISWMASAAAKQAARITSPWLRRHRVEVTDGLGPMAGDIMLYQARGEQIRDLLHRTVLDCRPPIVLLGHSLGGVIAVDSLVECAETAAKVPVVLTAGSQAPYLYEINALSSLPFGERIPAHFPDRWVNFWSPQDLLSFLAESVFARRGGCDAGRHIEDVRVDCREPFHWSHSAYFKRAEFISGLTRELQAVASKAGR